MRTAALAVTLLLAACSAAPHTAAPASTTHTANAADVGYLAAVRPSIQGSTDADLIALGKQACISLDSADLLTVAEGLTNQGISTAGAAAITTAAVASYCPQHKDKLPTP